MLAHMHAHTSNVLKHLRAGQRQWERPSAASQPTFIASPAFAGARPGYYFALGKQGLGYYLDDPRRIAEVRLLRQWLGAHSVIACGSNGLGPTVSLPDIRMACSAGPCSAPSVTPGPMMPGKRQARAAGL